MAQIQATKQEVKSAAKQAISDFIIPSVSDNDETIDTVYSMTKNGNTVLYEVAFSSGAGIANATLYDLQGRVVEANHDSPLQGIATLNVRNVPAGVYVLRVTDTNRKEYHQKIVIKK